MRVGRAPAVQPLVAAEPRAERYFSVEIEARPGINHLRFALELLVREALALGRTPVAFKPRLDPAHNLGHALDVEWDRYLDLAAVTLRFDGLPPLTVRVWQRHEVPGFDRLSALWVDRDHAITLAENETAEIIFRHNRSGLHVDGLHDAAFALPPCRVRLPPAAAVLERCRSVMGELGQYCAMHVRRGDVLAMKDQYPNVDRDTRPDRILATLRRHLAPQAKVYVMTNERERDFFAPLRAEFQVFQYVDFPPLRELIDSASPDNFLLFEIEKLLFEGASTRVHTFTHPEGGERIALTSDRGWA